MQNPEQISGHLKLYYGPMYAGKSSRLMADLTRYADLEHRVLYINHKDDIRETKGDEKFSTHSSQYHGLSQKITAVKLSTLVDVDVKDFDVIGVDEVQFFTGIIEPVKKWVRDMHKTVICAGLDGDSLRQPIGEILQLVPFADKSKKVQAVCQPCLMEKKSHVPRIIHAPFTACIAGLPGKNEGGKKVGGIDTYAAMCRYQYEKHIAGCGGKD